MFYLKLAWANIRKNKDTYLPFLASMVFLVILNLLMQVMLHNEGMQTLPQAMVVKNIFHFGNYVIMIFSVIFAFYTNSFLIKRRQKELGLYNILGMDKKSLGLMLLTESLLSLGLTLVLGLLSGAVFSKYLFLVMKKMTGFGADFVFQLSMKMAFSVAGFFAGIFVLLFLYNTLQLAKTNPIELLHGSDVGEKEPKTNWIMTIAGILCIGGGYCWALTVDNPISAVNFFFLAIAAVIIGTYLLLITASVTILKFLRKRKSIYYRPHAFVNISGMIYRMKQNGAGLASICILCTMVLVTVSSTASLFLGRENVLQTMNPVDVDFTTQLLDTELEGRVRSLAEAHSITIDESYNLSMADALMCENDGGKLTLAGEDMESLAKSTTIQFMTLADYEKLSGTSWTLAEDEALISPVKGSFKEKNITIGGQHLKVKKKMKKLDVFANVNTLVDTCFIVVKDASVVEDIYAGLKDKDGQPMQATFSTDLMMNISGKKKDREAFATALLNLSAELDNAHAGDVLPNERTSYSNVDSIDQDRRDNLTFTGGFLFIGVIFGLAFTIATALIIYYKQISEGYQDARRFDIMQKVGMGHKEVRRTILSQVLMVFLIPIAMAVLHLTIVMPVLKKLLLLFGLTDSRLINVITIACVAVFALCYLAVYWLTSKSYYRIVEREG